MKYANRDGLKLSQLRALVTVADRGNFSEAALRLQVSQSAVSHAIANLENELGVVLLSRGRYGARPTPVGERIIARARHILQLVDDLSREANQAKGLESGDVRVASFRSMSTHVLPEVIAQFHASFPGIRVAITEHYDYDGVEQTLREGLADLGFTYLPAPSEFETWELFRDEYLALLPPNAHVVGEVLTWEELASYPMIMYAEADSRSKTIAEHFAEHGHGLNLAYSVREDSTTVSMVQRGLGATVIPRLAAEPVPSDVQVYRLPHPLERIIGVAILAGSLQTPAVFAFLDFLKRQAQQIQSIAHSDRALPGHA